MHVPACSCSHRIESDNPRNATLREGTDTRYPRCRKMCVPRRSPTIWRQAHDQNNVICSTSRMSADNCADRRRSWRRAWIYGHPDSLACTRPRAWAGGLRTFARAHAFSYCLRRELGSNGLRGPGWSRAAAVVSETSIGQCGSCSNASMMKMLVHAYTSDV